MRRKKKEEEEEEREEERPIRFRVFCWLTVLWILFKVKDWKREEICATTSRGFCKDKGKCIMISYRPSGLHANLVQWD